MVFEPDPRARAIDIDNDFQYRYLRTVIVCHCKGITDRDIRRMVEQGTLPHAQEDPTRAAGSECGGCRKLIDRILVEQLGVGAGDDQKPAAR